MIFNVGYIIDFPVLYIFRIIICGKKILIPGIIKNDKYFLLKRIDTSVPYIDFCECDKTVTKVLYNRLRLISHEQSECHGGYYFVEPDDKLDGIFRIYYRNILKTPLQLKATSIVNYLSDNCLNLVRPVEEPCVYYKAAYCII